MENRRIGEGRGRPVTPEAYNALIFLNERLLENEGLSLQTSKTRIMTAEEFFAQSQFSPDSGAETNDEVSARSFLSLRVHYDPYSPTAEEDYEKIRDELTKFNIVGMLAKEMKKSRIHQAMIRKLVSAVRVLGAKERDLAVRSLLDNFPALYPVFPNVMMLLKRLLPDLEESLRDNVYSQVRGLVSGGSHITRVPINLAFALRTLADDPSEEAEALLNKAYKNTEKHFIRRDIILIMGRRGADYWLSDVRKSFQAMGPWEQRAMLVSSYILEDEGGHWRDAIKPGLDPFQRLVLKWAGEKKQQPRWEIPL